jgi:long-chain acyl-CoA synthetase
MTRLERYGSLVELFLARAEEHAATPFLWKRDSGEWRSLSWRQAAETAARLAAGLRSIGVRQGDRVVLVAENRPEWCIADLAIMMAGAVTVPTYTSNTEADHAHILADSGARAAIVSNSKLAGPLIRAAIASPACAQIVGIDELGIERAEGLTLHRWSELVDAQRADLAAVRGWAASQRDELACVIYTSGTGGAPRGVRHHHGAILANVGGVMPILEDFPPAPDVFLSVLPLSHAYEHSAGQWLPIALGAELYYADGLDGLAAAIQTVRPTVMIVVPRLLEVIRTRLVKAVEKQGGLSANLFGRALVLGERRRAAGGLGLADRPLDLLLGLTVRKSVGARFGGRLKALVSGGAPLSPEVGHFFDSLGLTVLQGYGQTEAGPVVSCNRPSAGIRMDSVGPPLANVEVRIADDGEIMVRGENVMHAYWERPEETAAAIRDGWLMTGDIGRLDEDGRLLITDRKKDIIVNDKGENVAPQRVEGLLALEPEIAQAMVYGDNRPYLVGLIVADSEWARSQPAGAGATPEATLRALQAAVDRVNAKLATVEKVRRIIVADEPFTIENRQLTPSLKIRRHVLKQVYGPRLDALYR